ncbi:MAG TPA: YbfB/YjiJ family MFS transporter, partial [Hyphomicrobiaceae bacterium]|nr:YbfB/YjiJ family MFS transporter [Hyphomicrobiaceae bacterium]
MAAGLALGMAVVNSFARFAYALVLPAMRSDLGWSYTDAGALNTANAIGYLIGAAAAFRSVRRL